MRTSISARIERHLCAILYAASRIRIACPPSFPFLPHRRVLLHQLHDEMADYMIRFVTVKRDNHDLEKVLNKLKELRERYLTISLDDRGTLMNQTYAFANQFRYMLELAMTITKGALLRDEFRGSHFKPDFPKRDDEHWLKHTIATYDPSKDEPVISYAPVDIRHLKPMLRDYVHAKRIKAKLENIPDNIVLPL